MEELVWFLDEVNKSGSGGDYDSLTLDSSGKPHISYRDPYWGLRYAYWDGETWSISLVDGTVDPKSSTSIALASLDNHWMTLRRTGDGKSALRPKIETRMLDSMHLG